MIFFLQRKKLIFWFHFPWTFWGLLTLTITLPGLASHWPWGSVGSFSFPSLWSAALDIGLIHNPPVSQTMRFLVLIAKVPLLTPQERFLITETNALLFTTQNVFIPTKPQPIQPAQDLVLIKSPLRWSLLADWPKQLKGPSRAVATRGSDSFLHLLPLTHPRLQGRWKRQVRILSVKPKMKTATITPNTK